MRNIVKNVTTPNGDDVIDDVNDAIRVSVVSSNTLITQYTEDSAAVSNPVGNAIILIRDDVLSGQTSADGDNVAVRGTDKGELYVKHVDAIPITDNGSTVSIDDGSGSLTVDGSVTVSATDLDIRNLSSVTDSVTVTGTVAATLSEPISVDDNGSSLTIDNAALSVTGGGVQASALRVTIASDSTGVLSVDDNGGSLTVDGTVAATQSGTWNIGTVSTITNVVHVDDNASTISVDDGGGTLTVDGSVTTNATKSATATLSNVASSATSVTLLSANSNRLGAAIFNDSTQILYVKFGTTASTSSYTVKMVAGAYYEIPFNYTGRIDGIWASANGSARITELTS